MTGGELAGRSELWWWCMCALIAIGLIAFVWREVTHAPTIQDPDDEWFAPPVGTKFAHLDKICVVVGDERRIDDEAFEQGVLAHYVACDGTVREIFFNTDQWRGLTAYRGIK